MAKIAFFPAAGRAGNGLSKLLQVQIDNFATTARSPPFVHSDSKTHLSHPVLIYLGLLSSLPFILLSQIQGSHHDTNRPSDLRYSVHIYSTYRQSSKSTVIALGPVSYSSDLAVHGNQNRTSVCHLGHIKIFCIKPVSG